MAFTEFCCRSGGSNLNAGTLDGSSTPPSVSAAYTYASGDWVQSTLVFTVASGNPQSDGVTVGQFASVYADGSTETTFVGKVSAVTTTTITIDGSQNGGTAPVDGTGNRTLRIGGAWQGPSGASSFPFTAVWRNQLAAPASTYTLRLNMCNDQTYSMTSQLSIANVGGAGGQKFVVEGYGTSYGDFGLATIDFGTTAAGVDISTVCHVGSLKATTAATTGTAIGMYFRGYYGNSATNVIVDGFRGDGISSAFQLHITNFNIVNVGGAGNYHGLKSNNGAIHANNGIITKHASSTGVGVYAHAGQGATLTRCILVGNGSNSGVYGTINLYKCDIYNFSRAISVYYGYGTNLTDCNIGYCSTLVYVSASATYTRFFNCGFGGGAAAYTTETDGLYDAPVLFVNRYDYVESPWVDAPNGDFTQSEDTAKAAGKITMFDPEGLITAPGGQTSIGSYFSAGGGQVFHPLGFGG